MQFEVPQFIEIEDKIFGPFTWRQFVYLAGGGGLCLILFLLLPFFFAIIPIAIVGLFVAALAFYPVNNRPFSHFLEAVYNHYKRDRLYLWQQKREIVYKDSFIPTTTVRNPLVTALSSGPRKDITALARRLELQAMQKK